MRRFMGYAFQRVPGGRDFLLKRRLEGFVFLAIFFAFFGLLAHRMGVSNLLNTIMQTAYNLLTHTVFFIMGITVLSGALAKLFVEFGVIRIIEFFLRPLMRPLYNLPGVAALAAVLSFFSDNPAVITVAKDATIRRRLTDLELYSLPNFGTSLGMGLVVVTFMSSLGYFAAAMVGVVAAMVGGLASTRLMQFLIRKEFPNSKKEIQLLKELNRQEDELGFQSRGTVLDRFLNALLDGGKSGVDLGLAIIPGVLIICTLVSLVTFGPKDPAVGYQGLAGEGVPLLTLAAGHVQWLFTALFGFKIPELLAFPITSLGSVGAALSFVPMLIKQGAVGANEIAVFTAMGMCWSGFLSTYAAIYDTLGRREFMLRAVLSQLVGGICAGSVAHFVWVGLAYFSF